MHRSGTSCLTGSLQQAGLHLGKYHSWNRYNLKGNRENQDIVDFHEALLLANRASWDKPPRKLKFTDADIEKARELIASYGAEGHWGFKDPRSLLALDVWQRATDRLQYVGIFRHPRAVACSLSRRAGDAMTEEQGIRLWFHYNNLLYKAWERHAFPLLCFDWDEHEFHRRLEPVLEALQLESIPADKRFYSKELMNYEGRQWDGLPWRVKRLYQKLSVACQLDAV
jgi:hypothetical protein